MVLKTTEDSVAFGAMHAWNLFQGVWRQGRHKPECHQSLPTVSWCVEGASYFRRDTHLLGE